MVSVMLFEVVHFLTDGSHATGCQIGEQASILMTLDCGLPQDSVLGLLLFLLYTVDILNIIHQHGLEGRCYADDTQTSLIVLWRIQRTSISDSYHALTVSIGGWPLTDSNSTATKQNLYGSVQRGNFVGCNRTLRLCLEFQ